MKRKVVVAPAANRDLDELARFIAEDDLAAALHFQTSVMNAFERLLTMPELGAPRWFDRPEFENLRMWPIPEFPNHLVYYRPTGTGIEVLRILHAARDIPDALNKG